MALPRQPNFKIYDPRRGEEWSTRLPDGTTFSSRTRQFLVIDYWPGRKTRLFELNDFAPLIVRSLLTTGATGFISLTPASPTLLAEAGAEVEWRQTRSSALGFFSITAEHLNRSMRLAQMAEYEDVVLGSCAQRFDVLPASRARRAVDLTFERLLTQADILGAVALYSAETGIVRILTRVYPDIDRELQELGARRRN